MKYLHVFPRLCAPPREGEASDGNGSPRDVFKGSSVLVVEDDFIVAFDVQTLLEERGVRVLGPAATLAEARAILANERPSAAILDVNLNGEYVFPLVGELRARHVPFVFATAYAEDDRLFPEDSRSVPRLSKPVLPELLIEQLERLLAT